MFRRIFVVALLVLVAMVIVKDGRVLRGMGLTGSCTVYANAVDGTQWERCEAGRIEGRPDLSGHGCSSAGVRGRDEYWHCPATLVSAPTGV